MTLMPSTPRPREPGAAPELIVQLTGSLAPRLGLALRLPVPSYGCSSRSARTLLAQRIGSCCGVQLAHRLDGVGLEPIPDSVWLLPGDEIAAVHTADSIVWLQPDAEG